MAGRREDIVALKKRKVVEYFFLIFTLIMFVFTILALFHILKVRADRIRDYGHTSTTQVEIQSRILKNRVSAVYSDLFFLPQLNDIIRDTSAGDSLSFDLVAKEYIRFMKSKRVYDRIVYVDSKGVKLMQINYDGGDPVVLPKGELQDEAYQLYFKNNMPISDCDVYVSSFGLEVEYAGSGHAPKPIINFGIPVHLDKQGRKMAVIVLSYLGQSLIDDMAQATKHYPGKFSLLNSDGYWLFNDNPAEEWGFKFEDRKGMTLAKQNPELWKHINSAEGVYQVVSDSNLYTAVTVDLFPGMISNNGSFTLLNTVGYAEMGVDSASLFRKSLNFSPFIVLLAAVLAYFFAKLFDQRDRLKDELHDRALYDSLTGLPNRRLLSEWGCCLIENAKRYRHKFALFFMDLDGFKSVNDNLGHDAGDEVLKKFADILRASVRASDTAARLGGDEFVLLLSRVKENEECILIAEKVLREVEKGMIIDGHDVRIGVSIGIVIPNLSGDYDMEELIKRADEAMYEIKKSGKNSYSIVDM